MRILLVISLTWIAWPLSTSACSCSELPAHYFLNTVARNQAVASVEIPQNAKGILFFSDIYHQDLGSIDTDKLQINRVPPAVTAAQFSIVEADTGRLLQPLVTRLNVDRQIGWGAAQRYYRKPYLGIFNSLQEVTADVMKAYGLFRVGPVGGFQSGHRYQFTFRPHGSAKQSLQAEARVGPAITPPSASGYTLGLAGRLAARMISLPEQANCGENTAALVQDLVYTVPQSLAPYHNLVLFFTQQRRHSNGDGRTLVFENSRYTSYQCARTPAGHSEVGALKDLSVERCNQYGQEFEDRLVKGYVGILEIEDTLHETATYTIPLKKSGNALCSAIKWSNGG